MYLRGQLGELPVKIGSFISFVVVGLLGVSIVSCSGKSGGIGNPPNNGSGDPDCKPSAAPNISQTTSGTVTVEGVLAGMFWFPQIQKADITIYRGCGDYFTSLIINNTTSPSESLANYNKIANFMKAYDSSAGNYEWFKLGNDPKKPNYSDLKITMTLTCSTQAVHNRVATPTSQQVVFFMALSPSALIEPGISNTATGYCVLNSIDLVGSADVLSCNRKDFTCPGNGSGSL